jgi:acyl-[acyl-carrier-protein] desaturase
MTRAIVPHPGSLADLICYVTFQERATQIAHRNTMARLDRDDKTGRGVLGLIAGDETRHFMFYRDLTSAAFEVDPSTLTIAVYTQAAAFAMPGTGIPNFTRHAVRIARAGIYGLPQFLGILVPLLAQWDIEHLAGLSPEAERARDALVGLVADLTARAARQAQHAAQSALRTD